MSYFNYEAIEKAKTTEGLRLIDKDDNAFTWVGPFNLLILFLGLVFIFTVTTAYYLNEDTTEGWVLTWSLFNIFVAVWLLYFLYRLIQSSAKYVIYHIK